jgi:hypothetical protein
MDKLEVYLDRVCRGIGGPRSLRQHVRQELREHLLDAVARHQTAGASPEESLDRALAEFGTSDEVRSELEATHGHRVMGVVIDKALQWKEMTMKSKWLWMSWANLAVAMVIALEILFITFVAMFIAPKFQQFLRDGWLDPAMLEEPIVSWMIALLDEVWVIGNKYGTVLLVCVVAAWGLFEWRVRGENKPMMRLSALATAAFGLTVVVVLTTGSLVILFCLGLPATGRLAGPFALAQTGNIEASTAEIEQAMAQKNWAAMQEPTDRAISALEALLKSGPALPALTVRNQRPTAQELHAHAEAASDSLVQAQQAIRDKDEARLQAAIGDFRKAYAPLREAAKRQQK